MFFRKILHHWFPGLCARDSPLVFVTDTIRCPTCGRLLAYRYPASDGPNRSLERYHVHICYPFAFDLFEAKVAANHNPPYTDPDPYQIEEMITLIHALPDDDSESEELEEGFSLPRSDFESSENSKSTVNERI